MIPADASQLMSDSTDGSDIPQIIAIYLSAMGLVDS